MKRSLSVRSAAVRAMRAQLGHDRVLAEPDEVDAGRRVWNAAVTHRPAVIARCTSAEDVRTVIRIARGAEAPISVRGGGHDCSGRAVADGAVVVDLSAMREVTVHGGTAVIGGGTTVSELLDAAEPYGLVAATGAIGTVGMAGLTLGGGYGRLMSRLGLAADNLVAAEVVTADGDIVSTDDDRSPDLLWCLKGAGGNFGAVTRLEVRLHTIPEITTGRFVFPLSGARHVIAGCLAVSLDAPDDLGLMFSVVPGPAGPVLCVTATWSGAPDLGQYHLDRLRGLGDAIGEETARQTLAAAVRPAAEVAPAGRCYRLSTRTLVDPPAPAVDALVRAGEVLPSAVSAINVHVVHGVAARTPTSAAAFGQRGDHLVVEILGSWEAVPGDDATGPRVRRWTMAAARALEPWSELGAWPNLLGPEEDTVARRSYGANAERIITTKKRWDPDGVFSSTIAIPEQ